ANISRSPKVDFSTESFTFFTALDAALASFLREFDSSLRASSLASSQIRECEITKRLFSLLNSIILKSVTSSTFNEVPSSLTECLDGQKPSTPYCKATISPLSPTLITVPSWIEPSTKIVSKVSQGFSSSCLCPNDNLRFSSSSSNTTTSNVSPTLVNSFG